MPNVTEEIQKYPSMQGHLSTVPFSSIARIIVQHRLDRQETPRDPVPAETVSCSWTRDPTRTVRQSVPEVELCPEVLLCNAANLDAGIISTGTYGISLKN